MHIESTTGDTALLIASTLDGDGDLEIKTLYNDEEVPVYIKKSAVRFLMNYLLFILEDSEEDKPQSGEDKTQ